MLHRSVPAPNPRLKLPAPLCDERKRWRSPPSVPTRVETGNPQEISSTLSRRGPLPTQLLASRRVDRISPFQMPFPELS